MTTNNQPCYVLQSGNGGGNRVVLADRYRDLLKKAQVQLPPKCLAPDTYNFTLCVTKGSDTACDSIMVTVLAGDVANFVLAAEDTLVAPNRDLVVKALVRGSQGTTVHWECMVAEGFGYVDLGRMSRSGIPTRFDSTTDQRSFNLVLKANTLKPNTRYKFRLIAINGNRMQTSAATVLKAVDLPKPPDCSV